MSPDVNHKEVLIVGAGPSGLMMAAQLLRHGIQPFIIDLKEGPTRHSKALAVQARTLEIYRQMGIDDETLAEGTEAHSLIFHQSEVHNQLDIGEAGKAQTAYPYLFMLEQSKNERILLNYLTKHSCPVQWHTRLQSLRQNDNQVQAIISEGDTDEKYTFNWVIGADGAHSIVRKYLNIEFKGAAYSQRFYLADLTLKRSFKKHTIQIFQKGKSLVIAFPMKEENRFRFIGPLPDDLHNLPDISFQNIQPALFAGFDYPVEIEECNWFATYRLHHRAAESFNLQHAFLIGDAAHIHSPVGGQGMNTGIQDAYNLAWKLSGVINGNYWPAILQSFSNERIPVARQLLKTTDRIFTVLISRNPIISTIRNFILPGILKRAWGNHKIRSKIFRLISQTGIHYRDSSLSVHHSNQTGIRAGDRLPYLTFYDEKKRAEANLHEWCKKPGFTLLILGYLDERNLFTVAKWITLNYPTGFNFYYLPYSKTNDHLFRELDIKDGRKKALIIRPDMHIGYINDIVDLDMIGNYLNEIIGWPAAGKRN